MDIDNISVNYHSSNNKDKVSESFGSSIYISSLSASSSSSSSEDNNITQKYQDNYENTMMYLSPFINEETSTNDTYNIVSTPDTTTKDKQSHNNKNKNKNKNKI